MTADKNTNALRRDNSCGGRLCFLYACGLVSAVAEEAEQIEEQVDEVKIECQRADCGDFAHLRRVAVLHHLFDFLGVPCGEADEDCHAGKRNQPFKDAAAHEDVDKRRIIKPISAINRNEPIFVRSRLVR